MRLCSTSSGTGSAITGWIEHWKGECHMEDMGMTDREQATMLMDKFIDLQRIKNAADRDKEIEYQLRTTRAKLEALKIVTEDLTMD